VTEARLDDLYQEHLQTVIRRTDESLAVAGFDALVVHAGVPPTLFLDDQAYPFKVNPHFKAWVPIVDNPHCLLIHRPGQRPTVLFHQPNDFWHKPASLPDGAWTHEVDLVSMADPATASVHWADLGTVAFIGPPQAFAGSEPAALNDAGLLARLHYDRAVKTAYELECLRRASDLGVLGHRAALGAFRAGGSEYAAHLSYLTACGQRESELPYNNIVAYNENAAVLHYQYLARQAPPHLRSFLIDAGAEYRGYAADITRTHAAADGRFAEFIDLLDKAQLRLCEEIVAGRDYRDVHLSAHRILGDAMHDIGLINVSGAEAMDLGVTSVFFPHGIGHLLGLQVHDVGGVMGDARGGELRRPEGHPFLRLTRMLEPGVVVTVEPGVYFIDSLLKSAADGPKKAFIDWAVVEELRPYGGIRIEDDVVATPGKPENLTRDAFARAAA
jgi:Xaa-Pro dipeptidase